MKVALSLIMVLRSSARSVTIQSSFRGRIAVSLEMTILFWVWCQETETRRCGLRHTLLRETWKSMSRARCTPKNSPVIQMIWLLRVAADGPALASGPKRSCNGDGKYMLVAVSSWMVCNMDLFRPAMMACSLWSTSHGSEWRPLWIRVSTDKTMRKDSSTYQFVQHDQ